MKDPSEAQQQSDYECDGKGVKVSYFLSGRFDNGKFLVVAQTRCHHEESLELASIFDKN